MIKLDEIQNRLRESIQQYPHSQGELAKRVGVSQQTISAYLHKDKFPALDTLANLCEVLDVSPNYILWGRE